MTILESESFDGLGEAATITTSNTSFDQVTGNSLDGTTAAIHGSGAMDLTPASGTHTARWTAAVDGRTSLYSRAYWRVGALPGNELWIMGVGNLADSRVGVMVLMPTGAIKLLDNGNNPGAGVSALTLGIGDEIRIEHHVDITAGTMQARLFVGSNLDGVTPDETLNAAIVLSDLADWRVGRILSRSTAVIVDELAIGDDWIGPAVTLDQPFDTLADTFEGDSGLWPASYGGTAVTGGQAVVDCVTADFSGFRSAAAYHLTGCTVGGQFFPPDAAGGTSAYMSIIVTTTTPGTDAAFNIDAGFLGVLLREGFSDGDAVFVEYDPTDHAWLRFREATGTLHWEASADGSTWSTLRSETAPDWVADPDLAFAVECKRDSGTDNTGAFDNINTFGGDTPHVGAARTTLFLTPSAVGARPSAGSATITLGLTPSAIGSALDDDPATGAAATRLHMAVSATGARPSVGAARVRLGLRAIATGARPATGTARVGLRLTVTAAGPTPDVPTGPPAGRETVTIVRTTPGGFDPYGDPLPGAVERIDVQGCIVADGATSATFGLEPAIEGRTPVITDYLVLPPADAPQVRHTDQLEVRGLLCEVIGRPFFWQNPLTGTQFGQQIRANEAEG